jgi:hypothetical protein
MSGTTERMPYFRFRLLNGLRDELWLTQTRQKVTLILFLQFTIPVAGVSAGVLRGMHTHSWLTGIIGAAGGLAVGLGIAWAFPRCLWHMLWFFVRKGWLLNPQPRPSHNPSEPTLMRLEEFRAQCKAFDHEDDRHTLVFLAIFLGLAIGIERVASYLDSTKPALAIQIAEGIGITALIIGFVFLWVRMKKRLYKKYGLLCRSCGRKITDAAGFVRLPYLGQCKHCGAQLVSLNDPESLARYYAPETANEQLDHARRVLRFAVPTLSVAAAVVMFDVLRLQMTGGKANFLENFSVFLLSHLGFWAALLSGPVLVVTLALLVLRRLRALRAKVAADGVNP